mmetsp:Transcript_22370/g.40431  ORF Transcript_22370/g.40431 Transcript_22370/m.40431 type:complete len:152 (+) Transcript_22370:63-518(+)
MTDVVIDLTLGPHMKVRQVFKDSKLIVADRAYLQYHRKVEYLYENPCEVWTMIASSISGYFGWTQATVILSEDTAVSMHSCIKNAFTVHAVSSVSDYSEISHFVTRELRASGVKAIFIMVGTAQALVNNLLRAFAEYEMDEGYSFTIVGSS